MLETLLVLAVMEFVGAIVGGSIAFSLGVQLGAKRESGRSASGTVHGRTNMAMVNKYDVRLLNELCDELGLDPDGSAASLTIDVKVDEVPRVTVCHALNDVQSGAIKQIVKRYALVPIEDQTDAVV
jgi:hypothetical protein